MTSNGSSDLSYCKLLRCYPLRRLWSRSDDNHDRRERERRELDPVSQQQREGEERSLKRRAYARAHGRSVGGRKGKWRLFLKTANRHGKNKRALPSLTRGEPRPSTLSHCLTVSSLYSCYTYYTYETVLETSTNIVKPEVPICVKLPLSDQREPQDGI